MDIETYLKSEGAREDVRALLESPINGANRSRWHSTAEPLASWVMQPEGAWICIARDRKSVV